MKITRYRLFTVIASIVFCVLPPASAAAQSVATPYLGFTQSGLGGGPAAGGFPLSGIDHVDLMSGSLSLRIPLLQIGGRGTAGFTMFYTVNSPWAMNREQQLVGSCYPSYLCSYTDKYYVSRGYWAPLHYNFTPGFLVARHAGVDIQACQSATGGFDRMLTRLTFVASDGSETELVDAIYNGEPKGLGPDCYTGQSRGTVWYSTNGSGATFISDAPISDMTSFYISRPSGNLMMKDGTKYGIDNGRVTSIRDRNGNIITFSYPGGDEEIVITDSLKRVIEVRRAESFIGVTITFKGFGSANRTISLVTDLESTLRPDFSSMHTNASAFPEIPNLQYPTQSVGKVGRYNRVILPDNRQYRIWHNNYGEIARLDLPTGGRIEYDYAAGFNAGPSGVHFGLAGIHRRMVTRRVYLNTSDTIPVEETKYSRPSAADPVTVRRVIPGAEVNLSYTKHYISGDPTSSMSYRVDPTDYQKWDDGLEWKTERYDANGTTLLRRIERNFQPRVTRVWGPSTVSYDPQLRSETATLTDVTPNLVSQSTYNYDQYNSVIDIYEYGFGAGAPGPLIRRTHTDYLTFNNGVGYAADTGIHIRNLPSQQQVFDAAGTKRVETIYEYDNYNQSSPDLFHAALADCPDISGHEGSFSTTYYKRGNVTKATRALLDNMGSVIGSISSYARYDIAGNVVALIDPRSADTPPNIIAATFDYRDNFGSPDGAAQSGGNPLNTQPPELTGQSAYAFPFKVTNALGHKSYTQFDYYLGKPVDSEDPNGVTTAYLYEDTLDRQTKLIRGLGGAGVFLPEAVQTLVIYNDSDFEVGGRPPHSITTILDKDVIGESNSGIGIKSIALYDGLGRTRRGAAYEGSTWTIKDTQFDELGRVSQVSNPYRGADPGSASPPSGLWTTTDYDALGRVIKVTTPDGAHIDTAYNGNQVTVTDQAGKKSSSETDALGRLIKVTEDPSGLNYETTYLYDVLNNLRKVTQGAQARWFAYDSLSRLIRVKNPEQAVNPNLSYTDPVTNDGNGWSMAYTYDENGNLKTKTDARGITATFNFDALNRLTSDSYTSYPNGSAGSVFVYDNPDPSKYGKGRLWHNYSYTTLPSGELKYPYNFIDAYDALGRPTSKTQKFLTGDCGGCSYYTKDYPVTRTYNLAGNVKSQTYPSGRTVSYGYDIAGRLSEFKGRLGGTPTDVFYAKDIRYNAWGRMTREEFGVNPGGHHTALYHRTYYNRRGQMFDTRLGTDGSSAWDVEDPLVWRWANGTWNRGAIRLFYSAGLNDYDSANPSQPDNNGNIYRMDHFVPNALDGGGNITSWALGADGYVYDELNRLTQVTESPAGGSGPGFVQKYIYDRWGNRKIDTVATSNVGGGVTDIDFQVNTANNRLLAPTDTGAPGDKMRYDAVGNLIWDEYSNPTNPSRDFGYDVNNRIGVVKNTSGVESARYLYDPDGRRVRRIISGVETWLVYGIDGELIAEYPYNTGASSPQKEYGYRSGQLLVVWDATETGNRQWQWLVSDHLGSPRVVVDRGGELSGIRRRDFLPFGEELASSIGHRNAPGAGYVVDNIRQRFDAYERDSETGLDFAQARYYGNVQGRFTSVDPENAGAIPDDPQSWNGYAFSRNSPVVFGDPDGTDYKFCVNGKCSYHTDPNAQEWFRREGIKLIDGKVFDKEGKQLGTYQWIDTSHGYFSGREMGQFYTEALPAVGKFTERAVAVAAVPYAVGLGVATGGAALGVGGIGFGTTVTTLGLSEGAVGTAAAAAAAAAAGETEFAVIGPKIATSNFLRMPNANILNLPKNVWNLARNDAWVQDLITRRVPVFMAQNTARAGTIFAREIAQLTAAGYMQVGKWLLPPP